MTTSFRCETCAGIDGMHIAVGEQPEIDELQEWLEDGGCEATDGCWVEPDGICEHGHESWLRTMGDDLMARVTQRQAEATLKAVRKAFRGQLMPGDKGPTLIRDWQWTSPTTPWAIVWEEGPFEWSYYVPEGGKTEEDLGLGIYLSVEPAVLPKGVWVEAVNGWSMAIWAQED